MKRRKFIQASALSAFSVSALGFIQFDGKKYVGDCETTSDILGPFYRPGSPKRSDLKLEGHQGKPIHLKGVILNEDCTTPYSNAKIELWHCDENGVYDNSSSEYKYRGTVFSDSSGNYSFDTILPVPYDAGGGMIRPAHYHMMVTAGGYQTLVTQLYFSGDKYIEKDNWASAKKAENRIINVSKSATGESTVTFNVGLSKKLAMEAASLDRLTGIYSTEDGVGPDLELFRKSETLWLRNENSDTVLDYLGQNSFEFRAQSLSTYKRLHFNLLSSGSIQITQEYHQEGSGLQTKLYTQKA